MAAERPNRTAMLRPIDDDEPTAANGCDLNVATGLNPGTKSHDDIRRLIAAASSSALLDQQGGEENFGTGDGFTVDDGDDNCDDRWDGDGACIMEAGLVESIDDSNANILLSTPLRRDSGNAVAVAPELCTLSEKSQELSQVIDCPSSVCDEGNDLPVVIATPRHLSLESEKDSSALTSVTPTTPPLGSYSSSYCTTTNATEDKLEVKPPSPVNEEELPCPGRETLTTSSPLQDVSPSSRSLTPEGSILKSNAVQSITDEVQASGENFLRQRAELESEKKMPKVTSMPAFQEAKPVEEIKNNTRTIKRSTSQTQYERRDSCGGISIGTAAAIGGAVAGLSALLYMKLK